MSSFIEKLDRQITEKFQKVFFNQLQTWRNRYFALTEYDMADETFWKEFQFRYIQNILNEIEDETLYELFDEMVLDFQ